MKIPQSCKSHKRYKGIRQPRCLGGTGCRICWLKYFSYWYEYYKLMGIKGIEVMVNLKEITQQARADQYQRERAALLEKQRLEEENHIIWLDIRKKMTPAKINELESKL